LDLEGASFETQNFDYFDMSVENSRLYVDLSLLASCVAYNKTDRSAEGGKAQTPPQLQEELAVESCKPNLPGKPVTESILGLLGRLYLQK